MLGLQAWREPLHPAKTTSFLHTSITLLYSYSFTMSGRICPCTSLLHGLPLFNRCLTFLYVLIINPLYFFQALLFDVRKGFNNSFPQRMADLIKRSFLTVSVRVLAENRLCNQTGIIWEAFNKGNFTRDRTV